LVIELRRILGKSVSPAKAKPKTCLPAARSMTNQQFF
jgi:hypothetical protein